MKLATQIDLHVGKWALIIDATGYTYHTKEINIPSDSSALVTLTPMLNQDYFVVSDDDSYAAMLLKPLSTNLTS